MKKFILIIIYIISAPLLFGQDYLFFEDNGATSYYDPSWGFANAPSELELINGNKFPVETNIKYTGKNSLRLKWKSVSGGNWALAVADNGWTLKDITQKDSLIFYLYSAVALAKNNLPVIYLEDGNNNKTPKINLSGYVNDLPDSEWVKASVPLQVFKNAPGGADLAKVKTIFFGQNSDTYNSSWITLYIDRIFMKSNDTAKPAVPLNVYAKGYHRHIDVFWDFSAAADVQEYRIYKEIEGAYKFIGTAAKDDRVFTDFIGAAGVGAKYKVSAANLNYNESDMSGAAEASTREMSDEELLDMLQEATFRYFWDYAHPVSGLARERTNSGNTVTMGGSGFGIMAMLAAAERNFITREQAAERLKTIVNFLSKADRFHGAFPHWMNGETGKVIPFGAKDDGGDLVETAFLMQGLLTAREYFNGSGALETGIRDTITSLWEGVDWSWYRRYPDSWFLYWHWSPTYTWDINMKLYGPNETLITYILAAASPTHPIPAQSYYEGYTSSNNYANGKTFYGYKLDVGYDYGGPLFFSHYSFLGLTPYFKDSFTNYFVNNRNHTLINRAYCIDNPKGFREYGENLWGLTASDDPAGYAAHEPVSVDNGTITPTAGLSSFPYTPVESMALFKNMYENYGGKIWGPYGFKDAFNPQLDWISNDYIAIDQVPIVVMVENYRTRLLWNTFMKNPEIKTAFAKIGLTEEAIAIDE
ncbi:MAG TPA: glucoamylase family protein, partial [Ignavibacteriales bacterium]|nr:glucoamylase family protein [Ignavibacteriales bacterium]